MFEADGHVFYRDCYGTIYESTWMTKNNHLDITTITKQPFTWIGPDDPPIILNGTLYKHGIITTVRQLLGPDPNGYVILSDSVSQEEGLFQIGFPNGPQPRDSFLYHLNNMVTDAIQTRVTIGPHWADPKHGTDIDMTWDDLIWVDVWAV